MTSVENDIMFEKLKQEDFVTCNLIPKDAKIDNISTPYVKSILSNKFVSGPDMKAVLCLFNSLVLHGKKTNTGIPKLGDSLNNVLHSIKRIGVESKEGDVFLAKLFAGNIEVILKTPQGDDTTDLSKEYFIGMLTINNLRYYVPTFMYTLGAFGCSDLKKHSKNKPESAMYVMYEMIPGISMRNFLNTKSLTLSSWLGVFGQLLLSLELAQRQYKFTHYDLHQENIMIRTKKNTEYNLNFDNATFSVNTDTIPVMIDYGYSTVEIDGVTYGESRLTVYGIMPYMLPGRDAYQILSIALFFLTLYNPHLVDKILPIYGVYGDGDPYNIKNKGIPAVQGASFEYFKALLRNGSGVNNVTPLEVFNYTMQLYPNEMSETFSVKTRDTYLPILFDSEIAAYNKALGKDPAKGVIENVSGCVDGIDSYIMSKYIAKVLKSYNTHMHDKNVQNLINQLDEPSKTSKIIDIALLEEVFTVPVVNQVELDNTAKDILGTKITRVNRNTIKRLEKSFKSIELFFSRMDPYLTYYYTILNLDDMSDALFNDWVVKFVTSCQFKSYNKNIGLYHRMTRWLYSLNKSLGV